MDYNWFDKPEQTEAIGHVHPAGERLYPCACVHGQSQLHDIRRPARNGSIDDPTADTGGGLR
jgi:hypothetical protein